MKNFVKSEWFGIVSLIVILTPQIAHSVHLFQVNSSHATADPWYAWCYAIGVDLAILIFTVHGWKHTSLIFLAATLATNILYFWPSGNLFGGILLSLMQSGTIYAYSHLYVEQVEKKEETAKKAQEPSALERYEMAKAQGIHIEAQPYKCPQCGYTTATAKKLNGHISGHKQKGDWLEDGYKDWEKQNHRRAMIVQKLNMAA